MAAALALALVTGGVPASADVEPGAPPPVAGPSAAEETGFTNVALAASGATATASGSEVSWLAPEKAIDGVVNRGTTGEAQSRWSSNASDSAWLSVAFAEPAVLDHVVIEWQERCAARYRLQVSQDGTTWVDATQEIRATCGSTDSQPLSALSAEQQGLEWSHLRMQSIERSTRPDGGKAALSLWEIEAWSPTEQGTDDVVAQWDFTAGHAEDLSGNGHDGTPAAGVTFVEAGAELDGSDEGEIVIDHAAAYQPEAIGPGEVWSLAIDDVVPMVVQGSHRAVMSGRADDDGWVVYIMPSGEIAFFIAQESGATAYAQARSGVVAAPGGSYDIVVQWDGSTASIEVTGAATGTGSVVPADYDATVEGGPTRIGNGGNSGTEFFYAGTIGGATVTIGSPDVVEPEPEEPEGEVRAAWNFADGHANDVSGNGHDGTPGTRVTFVEAGAAFDGTNDGEITVEYAPDYQPEAIAPGELWRLELDDVVPTAIGGHRAIFGTRSDDDGFIVYVMPDGRITLYVAQNTGSAGYIQVSSGVVAAAGRSYDIVAEWDGAGATIAVTGAGTGTGAGSPNGGYEPSDGSGPARFGNGGNTGSEFFFAGTIGGATISVLPQPEEPPAEAVCRPSDGAGVAPIDWASLGDDMPTDEASALLEDISLNATRYILTTWLPAQYGGQDWREYIDFGGTQEYSIRGPAMAAIGAAVPLATGTYDAEEIGLGEAEATERVTRLVSSLAYRHRANTPGGWGDVSTFWQTPLWSYYTGMAGWLVWDDLSAAEQACVQNMVEYEAERVPEPAYYRNADGEIISGGNTQAEENSSWATLLGLATAMMPDHESWQSWQQHNVELLIAGYSRPADVVSDQVLNGRRLSEVLDGSNIEDEGPVINHGFLHPIYMLAFDQSVNVALTSSLAGQATPEAAFHNIDLVYNALADLEFEAPPAREPGGTIYRPGSPEIYYPYGNDWGTKFPLYFGQADVIAEVFGADTLVAPGAAYWEHLHNTEALAMQERHADGRTYASTLESNYGLREERIAQMAGLTYLTRWLDAKDAIHVTSRPYTSATPDPVLGELEAPAATATALLERADALEGSGDLSGEQASALRVVATKLAGAVADVAQARADGVDGSVVAGTEAALGATADIATWLVEQMGAESLSEAVAVELTAVLERGITGLSTLHRTTVTGFDARLDVPDNRLVPGGTIHASVTVTNSGSNAVEDVAVLLQAPPGWTVTPVEEAMDADLGPSSSVTIEFEVEVPEDAELVWGTALAGAASYQAAGGGTVVAAYDAPLVPESFSEPPVTTAAVAGEQAASGWFTQMPTVTLAASDNVGVARTEYHLGDGEWLEYTGPVEVGEGEHVLGYRSVDTSGTAEEAGELELLIDVTAPAVDAVVVARAVTITASDATSGVASVEYSLDGGESWVAYSGPVEVGDAGGRVHYRAADVAGHVVVGAEPVIVDATELDVTATVAARCVVGRTVLAVRVENDNDMAVDLEIASDFGSRSTMDLEAGRSVASAFSTRSVSVAAGEVEVTAHAMVDGEEVTRTIDVDYAASSCGTSA